MRAWFRKLADNSLVSVCVALVLAFHAVNLSHGDFLSPLKDWRAQLGIVTLSLSSKDDDLASLPFVGLQPLPAPPEARPKKSSRRKRAKKPEPEAQKVIVVEKNEPPRPKLDAANQWLAWLGLHLRAQANQSQPRWINYRFRGRRYYYLRDEIAFQYPDKVPEVRQAFAEVTRLMERVVSRAGGTLVITPMPTKVSINRDRLPRWLPEQTLWTPVQPYDHHNAARAVYEQALVGAPESTVDVFRYFETFHHENPKADLYVPSNHEWSSLGIAITAIGVVENLRQRGWPLAKPHWTKLPTLGERADANMLALLNLPPDFGWLYRQTSKQEALYGINEVASRRSKHRLIVFGTCFSSRMRDTDGFANTLARALKRRKVINLAHEGGKTLSSIRTFAKRYKRIRQGDLVIWEFNVRETFTAPEIASIKRLLRRMARR